MAILNGTTSKADEIATLERWANQTEQQLESTAGQLETLRLGNERLSRENHDLGIRLDEQRKMYNTVVVAHSELMARAKVQALILERLERITKEAWFNGVFLDPDEMRFLFTNDVTEEEVAAINRASGFEGWRGLYNVDSFPFPAEDKPADSAEHEVADDPCEGCEEPGESCAGCAGRYEMRTEEQD